MKNDVCIQQQADEIVQFFDNLIENDCRYSMTFGNYKQIKIAIDKSDGNRKAMYINMLRIAGLTIVPQNKDFISLLKSQDIGLKK